MFSKLFRRRTEVPSDYSWADAPAVDALAKNRDKLQQSVTNPAFLTAQTLFWATPGADQLPVATSIQSQTCQRNHEIHQDFCCQCNIVWFIGNKRVTVKIDGCGMILIDASIDNRKEVTASEWAGFNVERAVEVLLDHIGIKFASC